MKFVYTCLFFSFKKTKSKTATKTRTHSYVSHHFGLLFGQVEKDGGETTKEEPLVDVSELPPEVPKSEESSSKAMDVKDVFEEAKPSEDIKPVAEPTSEPKAETAKEAPKEEEKKEVIADGVTKKPENDASSPKDKSDAPLVTV